MDILADLQKAMVHFPGKKPIKTGIFFEMVSVELKKTLIYCLYIIEITKWALAHFFLELTKIC